jgi:hypothetical protein
VTYQYPPGGQQFYGYPGPPPENHLVWAILATVFCCLPLGIVAIVKAGQVNSLWFQGYYVEARKAADSARTWAMWSAISSGILLVLYIVFIVIAVVVAGSSVGGFMP